MSNDIPNVYEELQDGERIDEIGFGGLKLIQEPSEFCFGVDAVILADFVSRESAVQKSYGRIADLGTGTGVIPLILAHKTQAGEIWGLEIQKKSAQRALRNVKLNGLEERITIVNAGVEDIIETRKLTDKVSKDIEAVSSGVETDDPEVEPETVLRLCEEAGTFDAVCCNPPYTEGGRGIPVTNEAKHVARHETTGSLEDFVECGAKLLGDKGNFFMVHRPSRLVDIFEACRKHKLEPKDIRLIVPREGETPNILLLHCVKNGGKELKWLKTLPIYKKSQKYSNEILAIYGK